MKWLNFGGEPANATHASFSFHAAVRDNELNSKWCTPVFTLQLSIREQIRHFFLPQLPLFEKSLAMHSTEGTLVLYCQHSAT